MSTYIRGPVCGTDNCPSRLWRIIAGRRTCQYGHVMEGDIEFNNEEEDAASTGVTTRRLNLTTNASGSFQSSLNLSQMSLSQKATKVQKAYGREARKLFLKSFQYILRRQCQWLQKEKQFPTEYPHVVKCIWLQYLNNLSRMDSSSPRDSFAVTGMVDHSERFSSSQGGDIFRDPGPWQDSRGEEGEQAETRLNICSTISILYLASLHIGYPVYVCDFLGWISSIKFPYYKSNLILPKDWRMRLPNYYLAQLDGNRVPKNAQLYHDIASMCSRTKFCSVFNTDTNIEGLVLKLIMYVALPPEFFFYTLELIHKLDDVENFKIIGHQKKRFTMFHLYPELRIISYFIICLRWVLVFDGMRDGEFKYPIGWITSLGEKLEVQHANKESYTRSLTKLLSKNETQGLDKWNTRQTTDFLDWIENDYLPAQKMIEDAYSHNLSLDQKISRKKLFDILPLEGVEGITQKPDSRISFIDELQEKYASLGFLLESYYEDTALNSDERIALKKRSIRKLEAALIKNLSLQFGVTVEQLKYAVDNIEKYLIMRSKVI